MYTLTVGNKTIEHLSLIDAMAIVDKMRQDGDDTPAQITEEKEGNE